MLETIDQNTVLAPGDKIRLTFRVEGWMIWRATQLAIVESRLRDEDYYQVTNIHDDGSLVTYQITIGDYPQPSQVQEAGVITPGVIIAVIIGILGPLAYWFLLEKVERVIIDTADTPLGEGIGDIASGIGDIGAGIAANIKPILVVIIIAIVAMLIYKFYK